MNIWKQHIAYLKDNPQGYWFKRKLYGWGWTPATKAGWGITGLFMVAIGTLAVMAEQQLAGLSPNQLLVAIVLLTVLFLVIVYKTGEPPRWQWGEYREK